MGRGPIPQHCIFVRVGEIKRGSRHGGSCCGKLLGSTRLTVRSYDRLRSGKRELAAQDQDIADMSFRGGGRERPDAERGAWSAQFQYWEDFNKRWSYVCCFSTIIVLCIGLVLVGAEVVEETRLKFVITAPLSVYRLRGLQIHSPV
jgi:hypothetical protein